MMRKKLIITFLLAALFGFTALGFAQPQKTSRPVHKNVMHGKILSLDPATNSMVVIQRKTGAKITIEVGPKVIATLKAGDHVRIELKKGSKTAESVTVIQNEKGKNKTERKG